MTSGSTTRAAKSRAARFGLARTLSAAVALSSVVACGAASEAVPATTNPPPSVPVQAPPSASSEPVLAPVPSGGPSPASHISRPNRALTPGAVIVNEATKVCGTATPADIRLTRAEKVAAFARYGLPYPSPHAAYSLDLLVPVELGGTTGPANAWPIASAGIGLHEKRRLESRLHDLVCGGSVPLAAAQNALESDWYAAYQRWAQR